MMPILFESSETTFTSNGIGRLSDALSCEITEERNGQFELVLYYPVTGMHYADIMMGRFIYAVPGRSRSKQAFEIYAISKPMGGIVTVNARHISYRLSLIPTMPFTASAPSDALNGLKNNAAEPCPFTFWTNKSNTANYKQDTPASIRSRLGGVEGSILDTYGGEYEWDMYTVKLWGSRGTDAGVSIRYGKNLKDLTQEESIEDTITGILPYFKSEETSVYLTERVIETESAANFPYHRTIPVDLTQEFNNTVPTETQLRNAANTYINTHSIGVPKVSLKVSFVNLADTEEYKDIAVLQDVKLCDTVKVTYEKLGVSATARVIKTVWDVLRGRYKTIELGDAKATMSSQIAEQQAVVNEVPSMLQSQIERATSLITGESGGYVVINRDAAGRPFEILIMDTDDINTAVNVWRWNQSGWGHSSSGYAGPYTLAATLDGGIVADFISAGTITGIAINNGSGTFSVDAAGNMKATSGEMTDVIALNKIVLQSKIYPSTTAIAIGELKLAEVNLGSYTEYAGNASYGHAVYGASKAITVDTGGFVSAGISRFSDYIIIDGKVYAQDNLSAKSIGTQGITCSSITDDGNLTVSGTKSRVVDTEDYDRRLLYCYETPSPTFGDIGEGKTDETGICLIFVDDILAETIDGDCKYQVFLQPYSGGAVCVTERNSMYFKVEGDPGTSFGWELKAIQRGYDTIRLEVLEEEEPPFDYAADAMKYLQGFLFNENEEAA